VKGVTKIINKKKLKTVLIIAVILSVLLFYRFTIFPTAVELICAEVKALQTEAIARAEKSLIFAHLYKDLYYYDKNADGDIILIRSNPYLINQLNHLTTEQMQKELRKIANGYLKVPLGVFLGTPLLLGLGPEVNLRVVGIGSVNCRLRSEFISQGINQTLHRHYIEVTASVDVAVSLKVVNITQTSEIFVAENLIVGKIPNAYLQGEESPNFLDLLP
jgi:sporulation protein YunB